MRVLLYPSTTAIGLEVQKALRNKTHFEIVTASMDQYPGVDHVIPAGLDTLSLANKIAKIQADEACDYVYFAHDEVNYQLAKYFNNCSEDVLSTIEECRFKSRIYKKFPNISPKGFRGFPAFAKPDNGQGSRGSFKINNPIDLARALKNKLLITEYLPYDEFTVDCFTDFKGELKFVGARQRKKTYKGVSTETCEVPVEGGQPKFRAFALELNAILKFNGAWFFQIKLNKHGFGKLLEVSPRISGCSSYWRMKGVNLPELTLYNSLKEEVTISPMNNFSLTMKTLQDKRYWESSIDFSRVYVDLDDCLIIKGQVNAELLSLIYKFRAQSKEIFLVTRNTSAIATMNNARMNPEVIDHIYSIYDNSPKSIFIESGVKAIFIDDSFKERNEVWNTRKIPVFSHNESVEMFS